MGPPNEANQSMPWNNNEATEKRNEITPGTKFLLSYNKNPSRDINETSNKRINEIAVSRAQEIGNEWCAKICETMDVESMNMTSY